MAQPTTNTSEILRFVVTTQVRENYGAHNWDGNGECPQYWKFKGGNEYLVEGARNAFEAMATVSLTLTSNEGFDEYVIASMPYGEWVLLLDDELREASLEGLRLVKV
jgi:hypothetical protein